MRPEVEPLAMLTSRPGFRKDTARIARQTLAMHLRTTHDIVDTVLNRYKKLPSRLWIELRLKQIWILAPPDGGK